MSKPLPLHNRWKSLGAQFAEYSGWPAHPPDLSQRNLEILAGWSLPSVFTDPIREHSCARSQVGLLDLSYKGKIEVTGEDRIGFLHNLLTQDIKQLKVGRLAKACLLTAQGRIVGLMDVVRFENRILLHTDPLLTQKLASALERYIIMERAELRDRSNDYCLLAVEGPRVSNLLRDAFPNVTQPLKSGDHASISFEGESITILRTSETGGDGAQILCPIAKAEAVVDQLLKSGKERHLQPIGQEALEILRIEASIPRYGIDYDETTVFPELGLDEAVSTTKGCYVGQEIVARIDTFGGLSKKLMGLEIEGDSVPERGCILIKEGERVGRITSSVFSPTLKRPIALAFVNRDYYQQGTTLEAETPNSRVPSKLVPLPFRLTKKASL